jgi:hypothetical protein
MLGLVLASLCLEDNQVAAVCKGTAAEQHNLTLLERSKIIRSMVSFRRKRLAVLVVGVPKGGWS